MAAQGDVLGRIRNTDGSTYTAVDISRIQPPVKCSAPAIKVTYQCELQALRPYWETAGAEAFLETTNVGAMQDSKQHGRQNL